MAKDPAARPRGVNFIFRKDSGILIPRSVFRRNKPYQERQGSLIPGVAHHVIQRGRNRQVVFVIEEDFQRYLENLVELKNDFGVKLYAGSRSGQRKNSCKLVGFYPELDPELTNLIGPNRRTAGRTEVLPVAKSC